MQEKIIEAIFDTWCEGYLGLKREQGPETDTAIKNICEHFGATEDDFYVVEIQVTQALCAREKEGFMDGFYVCLELMNGNIF